ncbi:helix-turn-helix domain-containing protein [Cupriavidus sp. 2KB_3]|uniref:helix-turn-helix domain-containing protein n=1 Tax=Cupriavidus sp. 2KB_3 TaxID=3232980 RepID=UPI003F920F4C
MSTHLRLKFGQRIRQLRLTSGLSQEEFADHVGFAHTYMSRIQTGAANPSRPCAAIAHMKAFHNACKTPNATSRF